MKAIIESKLENVTTGTMYTFVELLNAIQDATDQEDLRKRLRELESRKYLFLSNFLYGFGHNHFWVTLKRKPQDRLIFVEFN